MPSRCRVGARFEQHRVLVDDLLEHVPDLGDHRVDHLLGRLDVLDLLALDEAGHDERLEQLERHQLRQPALVQAQRRARHDHRSAGVVDALAEQVLAEAPLLALEHVRERLQGAVARPGDGAAAAAVVEQCVDGLLEHALLVVDDDLGRAEVEQPLQAVVPVDHPAVEVIQVRGREPAAVELHHRAQLRRDHRHDVEDHPVRLVVGLQEGVDDLEALDRTSLLLALGGVDRLLQQLGLGLEVDLLKQVAHGLGAHAAAEVLAPTERGAEAVLELAEGRLVVDDVLRLHLAEDLEDLAQALGRLLEVGLGVGDLGLEGLAELLAHLLAVLCLDPLRGAGGVGPELVVLVEALDRAGRRSLLVPLGDAEVGEAALQRLVQLLRALLALALVLAGLLLDFLLELDQVLLAGLGVDPGDHRCGEVQDLLELLGSHVDQVADPRGNALEEPDVGDGRGQVDVPHPLATDLGARDLDAAALADDALVADALVLAAVALPVLCGTEDALAEEPVLLGLQRAVVDRLGLGDLAGAPATDLLR